MTRSKFQSLLIFGKSLTGFYVFLLFEFSSQLVGASHHQYNSGRIRWESLSSLAPSTNEVLSYRTSTEVIPPEFLQADPSLELLSEPEPDWPVVVPKSESTKPQIHSPHSKLTVQSGDTVSFPCKVYNIGENQILWRHRQNILAGSNVSTYSDDRIQLLPDFTLQLRRVSARDAGAYECIVTTWPQLTVVHSLTVHDAPTLDLLPSSGSIEVTEGDNVEIQCIPNGYPKARIAWSMRDGAIPVHPVFLNQSKLTLRHVSPRFSVYVPAEEDISCPFFIPLRLETTKPCHSFFVFRATTSSKEQKSNGTSITEYNLYTGLYVCTADNGVGRPAFGAIYVRVIYAPVIKTPKRRVHGGVKVKAQLTCLVDADPKAEVQWRLGQNLVPLSDRVSTQVQGNLHLLVFNPVREYDLEKTYTCEANNSIGYDIKHIEFSGVPNAPIVNSWTTASWKDEETGTEGVEVTLFWVVECYSSLIDYRLHFRAAPVKAALTSSTPNKTPFSEITVPADPSSAFLHTKQFPIRGLDSGTIYEVAIKARNKFGWSHMSSVCYFSTFPNSSSIQQEEIKESFEQLNSPDSVVFISEWENPLPRPPGDGEDIDYSMVGSSATAPTIDSKLSSFLFPLSTAWTLMTTSTFIKTLHFQLLSTMKRNRIIR